MTTAIICSALLAVLLLLLGANVTRVRVNTGKAGGSQVPQDPASKLFIAVRAHGNAAEYIPVLIVLFLLVGARSPGPWYSSAAPRSAARSPDRVLLSP